MHQWNINAGRFGTHIIVGQNITPELGNTLKQKFGPEKFAVITSEPVWKLHGDTFSRSLDDAALQWHHILIPDGEAGKTWNVVGDVIEKMSQHGMNRKSVVIAFGGGAVGDAAGMAAACYMRGVPLVQVPTTLLAMVDSSLGGKTGVNLTTGKNLAGAFHQPQLLFADITFLSTLSKREIASGMAEIIKYGVIADQELFAKIHTGAPQNTAELVARCLRIKGAIVEQDEYEEKDLRALLNFGHTIGHAIEAAAGYGHLLHGEAIAIGMNSEAWLSTQLAGLSHTDHQKIVLACNRVGLPVQWADGSPDAILKIMARDKKFLYGKMRFVLADCIGHAFVHDGVTPQLARQAIELVTTQHQNP